MTSYNLKLYSNISLDELVTYSIYILLEENKEATFENIVAKCYELFPEKFSLIGYPQWPDSARVNKSWLRCRTDFKYIKGSVKNGFHLTSKGLEIVEKIQKRLKRPIAEKIVVSQKKAQARTKEEQFINELEKSEVFQRYLREKEETEISHFEFCDMLYCTLESSVSALNENLSKLKEYAQKYNRTELITFLLFVETEFSHVLNKTTGQEKYSGGMNRAKIKR